ncbi:MAG TPA: TerB family tellurite resistance protein [Erythrobacter sp.]|nr:TerB family tellurite resistance protein [Erythrobacter sp.]
MTDWFQNLKNIVNRHEPAADAHAMPRAAAALLLEMAMTDDGGAAVELEVIHEAMRTAFAMDPAELEDLIEQAHQAREEAVSLYDFTRGLRTGLSAEDRAELVEWLWRVAFADARLDKHEELMVRRVADLLGVSLSEFIRRKHLALGGGTGISGG